ncbi:uncharacterized protein EDB91DRAFT_262829 [Suillus paluster]|uniref:uncharacterized protein n=1 Tax=Suillus paluster TaxID=48578 RepID=UPI001B85D0A3|nr:uncharacterized protein EDB91DRAFT_262829 [Suillus paluster]KAG1754962.1 hypothetical protein EDB91DRAFT_262829 [Suillus paluster]
MKLVLTGVTGAAGIQIFRQAVLDAAITKITVLSRRALPSWMDIPENDKTEVVVLKDFLDYPGDLPARLAEHDACVWALGKSSIGLSDEEYTRITYDNTMHFVNSLQEAGTKDRTGEPFRFVFISGEGADPSGKSNVKFARIKGMTEKALWDLPPSSNIKASTMRPAYFFPSKDHPSDRENIRSPAARAIDCLAAPVMRTILPSMYTPIEDLGLFAIEAAKGRWSDENLFPNSKIREYIKALRAPDIQQ